MIFVVFAVIAIVGVFIAIRLMDHARSKDKIEWSKEDKQ